MKCEIWVDITKEQHVAILPYLRYNKRETGSHGRALTAHFPDVGPGMRVGDRLEPHNSLLDIACFDNLADSPARVLWWRLSSNTLCTDLTPILSPQYAATSNRVSCLDLLHAFWGADATRGVAHEVTVAYGWRLGHVRVDRK